MYANQVPLISYHLVITNLFSKCENFPLIHSSMLGINFQVLLIQGLIHMMLVTDN